MSAPSPAEPEPPDELFFRNVEVDGRIVDVRVAGPAIAQVGPGLRPVGAVEVVDGAGGALLPGLHDHHIHLLATAAASSSVSVGPSHVADRARLQSALRTADQALPPGRWLRAVGYHEVVAGELDRVVLDAIVSNRPVRVQHRTGARWTLNSVAIEALQLDQVEAPGAERDHRGELTGTFHRADDWLRRRWADPEPLALAPLGERLISCGVTGVTDATPFEDRSGLDLLADAVASGALPQRVVVMGGLDLVGLSFPAGVEQGPVKLVIDDSAYPSLAALAEGIDMAHRHSRCVAIHCVTRTAVVLAIAAWQDAGSRPGDRIEHGAVMTPELHPDIARLGLTVVTQPGFISERGDEYLADVDRDDLPHLYPCASLLDGGVAVAGSTDAPYTDVDPWASMRAAVHRTTPRGTVLGGAEAVSAQRALHLFLGSPDRPGGQTRTVTPGAPSDLCLLGVPLAAALRDLDASNVVATSRGGALVTTSREGQT